MKELRIKIKKDGEAYDTLAINLIGMTFLFYAGSYATKAVLTYIGLGSLASIGSFSFYLLWFLSFLNVVLEKIRILPKILLWEIAFIAFLIGSYYIFPNTQEYHVEYRMFLRQIFLVFLPCSCIISEIKDYSNAFKIMEKVSIVGIIILFISLFLGYIEMWDYQYFGVHISPFIIILFENYLLYRKKSDLFFSILGFFLILLGGRQSVIIVFITCLSLYLLENFINKKKIVIITMILILLIFFLYSNLYIEVFKVINELMKSFNIQMEALERIANGKLFDTSTRDIIYAYSVAIIGQNKNKISGLFSDRYYIRHFAQHSSWIAYPHNFYLEMLIDFGILLGGIISIYITYKVIKTVLFQKDKNKKRVGILICLLVFIRLLVSSSFVIEGYFYMMLAFIFSNKRHRLKLIRR